MVDWNLLENVTVQFEDVVVVVVVAFAASVAAASAQSLRSDWSDYCAPTIGLFGGPIGSKREKFEMECYTNEEEEEEGKKTFDWSAVTGCVVQSV